MAEDCKELRNGIYMHFFFRLSERKRCPKERIPAVPVGLLRSAFSLRGRNVLGAAPEIQRLTFFFWYLFFLWQDKKKSTQIKAETGM